MGTRCFLGLTCLEPTPQGDTARLVGDPGAHTVKPDLARGDTSKKQWGLGLFPGLTCWKLKMTGIGIVRELMHWNRRITCGGKGPPSGAYWLNAMYNKPGMLQDVPGAGGLRRILWLGSTAAQKKLGRAHYAQAREGRCLPGRHVHGACLEHSASCFTMLPHADVSDPPKHHIIM